MTTRLCIFDSITGTQLATIVDEDASTLYGTVIQVHLAIEKNKDPRLIVQYYSDVAPGVVEGVVDENTHLVLRGDLTPGASLHSSHRPVVSAD